MVRYPSVGATISTLSVTIASQKSEPKLRSVFGRIFVHSVSAEKQTLYYSLGREEKVISQCRQGSKSYITISIRTIKLYRSVDWEAKVILQSR